MAEQTLMYSIGTGCLKEDLAQLSSDRNARMELGANLGGLATGT